MHKFTEENWDKFNLKKCEIKQTKEEFLKEVKKNVDTALWVLMEVADWGMDKRGYLKELFMEVEVSDNDWFHVIKLEDKYIKLKWVDREYLINFVTPKTKTVIYFE